MAKLLCFEEAARKLRKKRNNSSCPSKESRAEAESTKNLANLFKITSSNPNTKNAVDREKQHLEKTLNEWILNAAVFKEKNSRHIAKGRILSCFQDNFQSTLNLSSLSLTDLPDCFASLQHIRKLNLDGNKLSKLPGSIGELRHLRILSVNNNLLFELPSYINKLSSLWLLSLNNNKLSRLPNQIGAAESLMTLSIKQNQLTALPESIGDLNYLHHLNLADNSLRALPEQLAELSALSMLCLNHNELRALPDNIGRLSKLGHLRLSNNLLSEIPTSILALSADIDLSGNPLSTDLIADLQNRLCSMQEDGPKICFDKAQSLSARAGEDDLGVVCDHWNSTLNFYGLETHQITLEHKIKLEKLADELPKFTTWLKLIPRTEGFKNPSILQTTALRIKNIIQVLIEQPTICKLFDAVADEKLAAGIDDLLSGLTEMESELAFMKADITADPKEMMQKLADFFAEHQDKSPGRKRQGWDTLETIETLFGDAKVQGKKTQNNQTEHNSDYTEIRYIDISDSIDDENPDDIPVLTMLAEVGDDLESMTHSSELTGIAAEEENHSLLPDRLN